MILGGDGAAVKAGANQIKLTLRITGGDRNGGPLPSPTTNTFEQTIETPGNARDRLAGPAALLLDRCPTPVTSMTDSITIRRPDDWHLHFCATAR